MRKLLFVDDTPDVLNALRTTLSRMGNEWDMEFVASGQEALAHLKKIPVDAVISDMVMPGMDGVSLLTEVRKTSPQTVRIGCTGYAGQEASLRSAGVAHQFLAKPFTPQDLKLLIDRACALRDILESEGIRRLVSGIKNLPSLPTVYQDLKAELQSPEPSIKNAARIVSQDIGMVTKILQMVNSAFFGLRTTVSNPEQAVLLLGLDTMKSLVLSIQVFSQFEGSQACFSLEMLWRHALVTSRNARAIAQAERAPQPVIEDALAAALLHDVGTLVLATNLPDQYAETLALQQYEELSQWEAERKVLGATHSEMGAYLLGIWGLSEPLVEAVAFHHTPMMCVSDGFTPLAAVHVADAFEEEDSAQAMDHPVELLDRTYLSQCGLEDRIAIWRNVCRQTPKED